MMAFIFQILTKFKMVALIIDVHAIPTMQPYQDKCSIKMSLLGQALKNLQENHREKSMGLGK